MLTGVQTFPHMPIDINDTFVGQTDDADDIDYDNFILSMDDYKHNLSLDVGKRKTSWISQKVF